MISKFSRAKTIVCHFDTSSEEEQQQHFKQQSPTACKVIKNISKLTFVESSDNQEENQSQFTQNLDLKKIQSQNVYQNTYFERKSQSQNKRQQRVNSNKRERFLCRGIGTMDGMIIGNGFGYDNEQGINYDQFDRSQIKRPPINNQSISHIAIKSEVQVTAKKQVRQQLSNQQLQLSLQKNKGSFVNQSKQKYVHSSQNQQQQQLDACSKTGGSQEESLNEQNIERNDNLQQKLVNQQNDNMRLLQSNQTLVKNSLAFSELISSTISSQNMIDFLFSPIPPRVRLQFEVIRHKGFLETSYQLWLCIGDTRSNLIKSVCYSINIESSVYHLLLNMDNQMPLNLARMSSDLKREQYLLITNELKDPKVMATVSSKISINTHRRMQLYIPTLDQTHRKFKPIFKNNVANNLRKLKSFKYTCDQVQKLQSIKIQQTVWETLTQRYCIKQSKRNILMTNKKHQMVFFMGKTLDNHYKLVSIQGISPVQLFTFAIAQLTI